MHPTTKRRGRSNRSPQRRPHPNRSPLHPHGGTGMKPTHQEIFLRELAMRMWIHTEESVRSRFSAQKWKVKGKVRFQPTQGDLGLYKHKELKGRFWCEEAAWRWGKEPLTPVLYRSEKRAIRTGKRFAKIHKYTNPTP